jgi:lysophospholipase L1-like esterase
MNKLREADAAMKKIHRISYVPLFDGLADKEAGVLPYFSSGDGVHLNNSGHQYVASAVYKKLIDLGD